MSSERPPARAAAAVIARERAAREAERAHLERRLAAAEEAQRAFSALAARQQALLEEFQSTTLWTWRRRWRRFQREFVHGDRRRRRELLGALGRLLARPVRRLLTRGRPAPARTLSPPTPSPASPADSTLDPAAILCFPAVGWEKRFQRPQQLARCFARAGQLVVYLHPAFTPLPAGCAYEAVAAHVELRPRDGNLYEAKLVATPRLTGEAEGPAIYRQAIQSEEDLRYLQWSLRAVREQLRYATTISLVSLPFWGPLALSLPDNWVIYDCLDEHAGFSTNALAMLAEESRLIAEADLVLATAPRLQQRVQRVRSDCALVPNGCDYAHFAAARPPDPRSARPVIGYYGAIADWFDSELVATVATARPDWDLVLIGDSRFADLTPLRRCTNVRLLGEQPYAELPALAAGFDVAIIPFQVNALTRSTNPVKVYEYLALGKPVVATPLPELQALPGLVQTAGDAEEFVAAIARALVEERPELALARREFAQENTWEARYRSLLAALHAGPLPRVSVLLVTFNKWEVTRACLDSLYRETRYPDLEIVIVDNASTDATRDELAKLSSRRGVNVILNEDNRGFAAGCNQAAAAATGDVLVFLNNDTIVRPGWLQELVRCLRDSEVGMVGPMTDAAGNDQVLGICADRPAEEEQISAVLRLRQGRQRDTRMLGFFCAALRRSVYEQVGPLDEGFVTGLFEDDDYSLRVLTAGYRLVVAEGAFVHHARRASFSQLGAGVRDRLWEQNRARFERKHGVTWRRPAEPLQVQLRDLSPEEIARLLQAIGCPTLLFAADVDFWSPWRRPQQLALAFARLGWMVFYLTENQQHDRADGFEEFDYNLLLTNDVSRLRAVAFDLVLSTTKRDGLESVRSRHRLTEMPDAGGGDWEAQVREILRRAEQP